MGADLPGLAALFAAALRAEGVPADADRATRFTRAVVLLAPVTTGELYRCALPTLVSSPAEIEILNRLFAGVFGGLDDPAEFRGDTPSAALSTTLSNTALSTVDSWTASGAAASGAPTSGKAREVPVASQASAAERLGGKDFGELEPAELALLADLMRKFRISTPLRRSRRYRPARRGSAIDLRETLRRARRTAGQPIALRRRAVRLKPRKLVVLCDISGSMEAYARAMLQLLYCAAGGADAEVFTFATRLTRLTRALAGRPSHALRQAAETAPDWSGGTRIGAAVRKLLGTGTTRGAVVLIVSDGWDTGDPAELGAAMERLSRLAYRVVWANPRTASPRYRPLVGGMAAAWPHCDAVVSAHSLDALDPLLAALRR